MKLEIYTRAAEILEENGWIAAEREDYSGRGMCGETTPAIVTGAPLVAVGWAVTCAYMEHAGVGALPEDASEFLPGHQDSMGLDMVVY